MSNEGFEHLVAGCLVLFDPLLFLFGNSFFCGDTRSKPRKGPFRGCSE